MIKYTFKVCKEISSIKEYLVDVEKFVLVHPLIYKMQHLGDNTYKVFEKIKMGIIPFYFTYKANIKQSGEAVHIEATVMGLARLSMYFTFKKEEEATIVSEELSIKSFLPIRGYMEKLIKEQHRVMFERIEAS